MGTGKILLGPIITEFKILGNKRSGKLRAVIFDIKVLKRENLKNGMIMVKIQQGSPIKNIRQ